jgi:hypothetical protein
MVRQRALGVGVLLLVSGCAGGSGAGTDAPTPSLPADKPLRELSAAEAEALCEWESTLLDRGKCLQDAILAGGFEGQISADPATLRKARDICGRELELCTAPDRVATHVLGCIQHVRTGFAVCPLRVSDAEACDHDLARDYAAQPACAALTEQNFRPVLYSTTPASCLAPACGH